MLHLGTVLLVTLAVSSLQSFIWICGWRAWRDLLPLKYFAAGFSMITLGVLAMVLRGPAPGPVMVVVANVAIKIGLVLLADGLARFLGQPSHRRLGLLLLVSYTLFWAMAVLYRPGDVALRIHSSTLFTVIVMLLMCRDLLRDRSQSALLRLGTIATLGCYILACLLQSLLEIRLPEDFQSAAVLADRNAWYLLIGTLFMIGFFTCLVFMVGARLSDNLRQRNSALTAEIAKRRELERRLGASLETERSLREEQADFIRVVSHEFRTPLAVIRNSLDLLGLEAAPSPAQLASRHANIRDGLERMFALIERFMVAERDPGALREWTRVEGLLAQLVLHFELTGQSGRLQVLPGPDTEGCWLYVDPDMVETALINLIDNALKYSPASAPVEIRTALIADALQIEVRDHGIGIPEDERHKIGRRFYRGSNVRPGTGTGLGLHLVRRLLDYHAGQILLQAAEGGGTRAVLRLPLPEAPRGAAPAPDDAGPTQDAAEAGPRPADAAWAGVEQADPHQTEAGQTEASPADPDRARAGQTEAGRAGAALAAPPFPRNAPTGQDSSEAPPAPSPFGGARA